MYVDHKFTTKKVAIRNCLSEVRMLTLMTITSAAISLDVFELKQALSFKSTQTKRKL